MNSTGIFNGENYGDVFRFISNKRRSGTLDLTINGEVIRIAFYNGKVVDALKGQEPTAKALMDWLIDGEILGSEVAYDELSLPKELYENLVSQFPGFMPANDFKEMVRERVLNVLFNINFKAGGYYEFRSEVPSFDRDFSPALSVGQLLIDLVSFEADESRFNELFPLDYVVRRTNIKPGALLGGESILYGLLDVPSIVEGLKRASLMSQFGFREALLSLISEGFIESISPKDLGEDIAPPSLSEFPEEEEEDNDLTSPFLAISDELEPSLQISTQDELEEIKDSTIITSSDDFKKLSSNSKVNDNLLFIDPPDQEEIDQLVGFDKEESSNKLANFAVENNTNFEINLPDFSEQREEEEVSSTIADTLLSSNEILNSDPNICEEDIIEAHHAHDIRQFEENDAESFQKVISKQSIEEEKELTTSDSDNEYSSDSDYENEIKQVIDREEELANKRADFDYDSVTDLEVTSNISNLNEINDKPEKIIHSFVSNEKLLRTEEFQRFQVLSVDTSSSDDKNLLSLKQTEEIISFQLQTKISEKNSDDILIEPQQTDERHDWNDEESEEDDEGDTFELNKRYLQNEKRFNLSRRLNLSARSVKRSIRMANARFAKSNILHQYIVLTYIIFAIFAPLYFWRELINKF